MDTNMNQALALLDAYIERDRTADPSDRVYVHNARVAVQQSAERAVKDDDRETYERCLAAVEAFRVRGLDLPRLPYRRPGEAIESAIARMRLEG